MWKSFFGFTYREVLLGNRLCNDIHICGSTYHNNSHTAFHIDLSEELMGGTLRIPFTLLYMLLIAVFVITLLCFSSRTFKLNFIEKISFIFISVLCIIIENLIVVTQTVKYKSHIRLLTNTLYMVFFLVLALFVALTIYVYQLGIQRERFLQLSKEQIISDMENKQYEQIISSIAELRYLKHDIYNHLNALNTLLSNQDYIEAQHYIHELSDSIESDHYILTSGNSTMDSILTNKFIQCKSSGIKVNYSVFYQNVYLFPTSRYAQLSAIYLTMPLRPA